MNQVTIERTEKYLVVRIPIKSVGIGKALISARSKNVIDKAIAEGFRDIEAGRVFGPFKNIRDFKTALKKR
ncbi:MAG: hypothetical protein HY093_00170 [Candidatus Liptonbacteria bacterium]|nr:hypothetical protein [Candidatus Liptonbacteria bacterium]